MKRNLCIKFTNLSKHDCKLKFEIWHAARLRAVVHAGLCACHVCVSVLPCVPPCVLPCPPSFCASPMRSPSPCAPRSSCVILSVLLVSSILCQAMCLTVCLNAPSMCPPPISIRGMPPCVLPCVPPCVLPCVPLCVPPCVPSVCFCAFFWCPPVCQAACPHRVSACTFHVSPNFPSGHATVRPSVRPTVRPSVCPSVRPVCVLLRVLLMSSSVSSCVPHRVSPYTIHMSPQFSSGCVSPRAVHVFTPQCPSGHAAV